MARSKYVFPHTMGRGGYTHVKEKMIEKKEIEPDEEPTRGTLWLKGRVNKDGEVSDVRKGVVMQEAWEVEGIQEETVKSVGAKKTTRSIRKDSSSQDSQSKEMCRGGFGSELMAKNQVVSDPIGNITNHKCANACLQMQAANVQCTNSMCICNLQMQCANACLQMQAANAMYKCNVHMQAANAMCKLQ
ncbi:reverse transcriptase domain-containing protein [Tanacetum coccineum]